MLSDCFTPRIRQQHEELAGEQTTATKPDLPAPTTISCEIGVLKNSAGSAFVSIQGTKVTCSVQSPRANQKAGNQFSDAAILECELRLPSSTSSSIDLNGSSQLSARERHASVLLKTSLEGSLRLDLYPKSIISIQCVVLEEDGNELSAAIICSSLAIADAGIEQLDLISSWSIFRNQEELSLATEDNHQTCSDIEVGGKDMQAFPRELRGNECIKGATVVVSEMVQLDQITQISFEGRLDPHELGILVHRCRTANIIVRKVMEDSLRRKLLQEFRGI